MLRFGVELCRIQHNAGRLFGFEHPSTATSWEDVSLQELVKMSGVLISLLDMCQYGMVASDKDGEAPVRKTTKIVTNAPDISGALSARCEGGIDMFTWCRVDRRLLRFTRLVSAVLS